MRPSRRVSPQLETIESRKLLSTADPVLTTTAAEVSTMIFPPPLLLSGQVRGTAVLRNHGIPDVGDLYSLHGIGRVGPMGQVSAQGSFQTTSLIGRPMGSLTLKNRLGQVDLQITGTPTGTPDTLNFVVVRATGKFANLKGTGGVIELHLGRGPNSALAFRMGINPFMIL